MEVHRIILKNPRASAFLLACGFAVAGGITMPIMLHGMASPGTPPATSATSNADDTPVIAGTLQKGTPDYTTILPAGHTIADYGGWTRVSPPKRDPVYAYVDHIGAIPITVSQQPLPKDFKDNPDAEVRSLAEGYGATKILKAGTTTVYVGTSAKGPQSVICVKSNLLILIKAAAAVSDGEWQDYIQSLS